MTDYIIRRTISYEGRGLVVWEMLGVVTWWRAKPAVCIKFTVCRVAILYLKRGLKFEPIPHLYKCVVLNHGI